MSEQYPEMTPRVEVQGTMRAYRTKDCRYHIKGSICVDCDEKYYPPREGLMCPRCGSRNLKDYFPPKRGKVLVCWIDNVGYPAVGYTDLPPRTIVMVKLEDGLHVQSEIVEKEGETVEKGTPVKMVVRKHKKEDTGNWVYGYKFVEVK